MNPRRLLTPVGAGLTTFLLVAVVVIETLQMEFSAIIGLPLGVLAGSVVAIGLWLRRDDLRRRVRRVATAYAAFGIAVLTFLSLRYVNIGRSVLTFDGIVGGSLVVVVIVYILLSLNDRKRT
ncbi:hypothetical protein EGH24_06625 [Halonotius terrestris]|uniref:DUF8147 domain-containing protein n=1 Tax=Halonotius terrestris TaxID=2487750 RepID=A0A8J8TCD6_9EURY|nr:hypothetical protein [Halonotius terrestris]TQQ83102.1 hypothetical protein EGH24_06625 [Halonotius terrestris]